MNDPAIGRPAIRRSGDGATDDPPVRRWGDRRSAGQRFHRLPMAGPGTVYECQECETITIASEACPACGSEDLESVRFRG